MEGNRLRELGPALCVDPPPPRSQHSPDPLSLTSSPLAGLAAAGPRAASPPQQLGVRGLNYAALQMAEAPCVPALQPALALN